MRQIIDPQFQLREQDIAAIELDHKSRDDIPRLLRGLSFIDTEAAVRERVFAILAEVRPDRVDDTGTVRTVSADTGRPGMPQWRILVLGTLRLGLNADYDRIQELANQHVTIRQRLGHSAVASAINDLEAHGLDLCPDHGLDGFKRYVGMAVVARNVHRLGAILLAAEAEQERRRQRRAA